MIDLVAVGYYLSYFPPYDLSFQYQLLRLVARKILNQHEGFYDDIAHYLIPPREISNLDKHIAAAFSNAYQILEDPFEAMDVVQEALVAIHRLPYEPKNFPGYLIVTVRNSAARRCKTRARYKRIPSDEFTQLANKAKDELVSLFPAITNETPEKQVIRQEMCDLIRKIVDTLPPKHRQVIHLHYYEEMSISEIAEKLNLPKGTILSRLSLARKALRPKLLKVILCGNL